MSSPVPMTRTRTYTFGFLFIGLSVALFFSIAQIARAEDTAPQGISGGEQQRHPLPFVNKIKTEVQNLRGEIQDKRIQIQDMHASSTEIHRETRDDHREMASSTRDMHTNMLENHRELASSTKDAHRDTMQEHRNAIKNEMVRRAQMQFDLVTKRLSVAIDRLDNISGRIDSRITKLKADGISMTTAESLQMVAKGKIDAAYTAVKAITMPTISSDTASTTTQMMNNALKDTRVQVKTAEDAIKEAQKALNAVVVEIKSKGGEKADKEGTSTPQQ